MNSVIFLIIFSHFFYYTFRSVQRIFIYKHSIEKEKDLLNELTTSGTSEETFFYREQAMSCC